IKVLPSWRPDKAFNIEQATFNDYMAKLGEVSDTDIRRFADLQTALTKRRIYFAAHGCKVSDHALDVVMFAEANEAELDSILARRLAGETRASTKWHSSKLRYWCPWCRICTSRLGTAVPHWRAA
ncbi:glucuronate isomerase, partial [Shigella flexneri]